MKTTTTPKPAVKVDPKAVATLQAKIARFVGTGALTAAPHTYHH
ncbi:hypothetical protein ACIQM4_27795 [Streptomyces sp. NPDC091272]